MRFLVPILMVVMVFLYDPMTKAGVVALAVGVIGYNIVTLVVLGAGNLESAAVKRLGLTMTGLDIVVASLTFVLFVGDPVSIPVAVFPFVAFELGTRYDNRGMAIGIGLFTAVIAVRMASQIFVFDNPLRPGNVVFFLVVITLLLSVSRDLRVAETERLAAVRERERIARDFRGTVAHVMKQVGIDDREMTYQNVIEALRRMCATDDQGREGDEAGVELGKRLTELISARPEDSYGLTPRELEILRMMASDATYQQIADRLFISPSTVRNHASSIMRKLGVGSRHQAVDFAREHHFI